jgi:hypothetical protein
MHEARIILKTLAMAATATAGAGYGVLLYAPANGFIYTHTISWWLPFQQALVWGIFGIFKYAGYGLILALFIALVGFYGDYHKRERNFLRPFVLWLLAGYVFGLLAGTLSSTIIGHVPTISM